MKVEFVSIVFWSFAAAVAGVALYKPTPEAQAARVERAERAKVASDKREADLEEKIRLCSINAPPDECDRAFRCESDPCYCSVCD